MADDVLLQLDRVGKTFRSGLLGRRVEAVREVSLTLRRGGQEVLLADWGREILAECRPIAEAMDAALGGGEGA